jgi:hypothetical protein
METIMEAGDDCEEQSKMAGFVSRPYLIRRTLNFHRSSIKVVIPVKAGIQHLFIKEALIKSHCRHAGEACPRMNLAGSPHPEHSLTPLDSGPGLQSAGAGPHRNDEQGEAVLVQGFLKTSIPAFTGNCSCISSTSAFHGGRAGMMAG